MEKSARKWVIGLSAMLAFVAIVALIDATSIDTALPAMAIGVAAWAISLLRRPVALALFGPPVAILLLMGANSQGLARGVVLFMSLALGTALAAAVIGGWVFDRLLHKAPKDAA
ncbi:MAG: hypothetical protein J0L50_05910 [Sphingomonadales bacterium]|nr:hypothetical protein [Sphingomonadales bacterium]